MNKLIEKLEEYKGSTFIYYLESNMYFANSQVRNYHYTVEGNDILLHTAGEDDLIAFKIKLDSIEDIRIDYDFINITFYNDTYLHVDLVF